MAEAVELVGAQARRAADQPQPRQGVGGAAVVGPDAGVEGAPQRRPGVLAGRALAQRRGDFGADRLLGDEDRLLLGLEVAEEAGAADPGRLGDLGRGHGVEAAFGEDVEGDRGDLDPDVPACRCGGRCLCRPLQTFHDLTFRSSLLTRPFRFWSSIPGFPAKHGANIQPPPLRDNLRRAMKGMSLEHKIGIGFWVGVVVFMLSQILLVVFAIAFFLGHFVWPQ